MDGALPGGLEATRPAASVAVAAVDRAAAAAVVVVVVAVAVAVAAVRRRHRPRRSIRTAAVRGRPCSSPALNPSAATMLVALFERPAT
jgi:hypothetical protein